MGRPSMSCACQPSEPFTLCDLHAREFQRRMDARLDVRRIWNEALNKIEERLVPRSRFKSPTDEWISKNIHDLRRTDNGEVPTED